MLVSPAPTGVTQIELAFDMDANQVLEIRTRYKGTGESYVADVNFLGGLSEDEVQTMQNEVGRMAVEDKIKRQIAKQKNAKIFCLLSCLRVPYTNYRLDIR